MIALRLSMLLLVSTLVGSDASTGPMANLEASLVASAAHSTTVAVRHGSCVVVLDRQPKSKSSPLEITTDEVSSAPFVDMFGLRLSLDESAEVSTTASRSLLLGNECFCSMTGFTPDVAHLQRVLEKDVEVHEFVYSQCMPFRKTALSLSSYLQRAAESSGSRPFGVQALLVGYEAGSVHLMTCDPTGSLRHYGGIATAIGRHSSLVRKALVDRVADVHDVASSLLAAYKSIEAAIEEANQGRQDSKFSARVIWWDESGVHCGYVAPSCLLELETE